MKRPNNPKYWAECALRRIGWKLQEEYNLSNDELFKFHALAQDYEDKISKLIEEINNTKH